MNKKSSTSNKMSESKGKQSLLNKSVLNETSRIPLSHNRRTVSVPTMKVKSDKKVLTTESSVVKRSNTVKTRTEILKHNNSDPAVSAMLRRSPRSKVVSNKAPLLTNLPKATPPKSNEKITKPKTPGSITKRKPHGGVLINRKMLQKLAELKKQMS